jgi:hypothetical protein
VRYDNGTKERVRERLASAFHHGSFATPEKLGIPVSELMRRGAFAYESNESDAELGALADAAKGAADRAGAAIEDALAFIEASNKRISSMEAKAAQGAV